MSDRAIRWEIFKDSQGQFRFRFRAGNGEIVCQSEGYVDKPACNDGIDCIEMAVRATVQFSGTYSTIPRVEVEA